MAEVFFFITAVFVFGGAIGVVGLRNPFYSVLALVVHLFGLAGMFLLLRAEFVAAAQIVVYAGAVMVLYVFVVAYVGGRDEPLRGPTGGAPRALAVLFALALLAEICIAVLGSGLQLLDTEGAGYQPGPEALGTPAAIGRLLLTKFLFPFEAASILLLVAAVGAVVLARRRSGVATIDERISFLDALRPQGTGTMLEAVSGRTGTADMADEQRQLERAGGGARDEEGGW